MAVTIGHASIDENKTIKGGAAGDQTKKEVCTRSWYSKPWTSVIRPKSRTVAERIAIAMEQACANDKIGYDQSQRTTLYTYAKAANWDISKVTAACECDCSSLVAVCVNAAGIKVSKDVYTGNELSALNATGAFTVLKDSKYTDSSANLLRGDILLGTGHTAIVLSNGSSAVSSSGTTKPTTTTTTTATTTRTNATEKPWVGPVKSLSGTYVVTGVSLLNVRNGAGTTPNKYGKDKTILVSIPNGTKVQNYGYYTDVDGTKWLYVQFTFKGIVYTGFASYKHLVKK